MLKSLLPMAKSYIGKIDEVISGVLKSTPLQEGETHTSFVIFTGADGNCYLQQVAYKSECPTRIISREPLGKFLAKLLGEVEKNTEE